MSVPPLDRRTSVAIGVFVIAVFGAGAVLAKLAGGPTWLVVGYAASGLAIASLQLLLHGRRRREARPPARPPRRAAPARSYSHLDESRFLGHAQELQELCAARDLRVQDVVWVPPQALVVVKLLHVTDATPDLSQLLAWLGDQGLTVTAIDLGLESTRAGADVAGVDPHSWALESLRVAGGPDS